MAEIVGSITTAPVSVTVSPPAESLAIALRAGYKTSEFWFTLAATMLSGAYSVGIIGSGTAAQVAGLGAFVLTQAGYAVSRGLAKAGS